MALDNGEIIVGEKAYYQLKQDPENVIDSIKRIMGRDNSDPIVQWQTQHLSYKIKAPSQGKEDGLVVILGGKEYEPEDIAAQILKQVVKNAETYQENQGQKTKITEAVIAIPAYLNDQQRYAMQNAAKRAGLEVKELLYEPIAAAISYGFKPGSDDCQTILVYDLGGGTFDASVISAIGDWFSELGKAGDLWLGGDDIDNKLIELVKQKVAQEEDLDDIDALIARMPSRKQKRLIDSFKLVAEQVKIDLSHRTETQICIAEPLIDEFGSLIFIMPFITRSEFEQLILPLVDRTIKICQQAIEDAGITQDDIDVILMVGGSSLIPFVQQNLKQVFGYDKVVVHPRPIYAIAEGAAIVAAGLVDKNLTVSRNCYIEFPDDPRFLLIQKGEYLPLKTSVIIKTKADGQRFINLKLFSPDEVENQPNSPFIDESIGQIYLALDKHYPKGTEIVLIAEIDEQNEALQLTAHLRNDESVRVSCALGRGDQDTAIAKEVEELIDQFNQEREFTIKEYEEVNQLAGEIIQATNLMIGDNGRIREELRKVALEKLKKLKILSSRKYNSMSNNPYDILGVSPAASKDEIEKAFKARMKEKKRHPKILTAARNKLVKNNEDRLVADYLLPALPPILRFKRYDISELDKPTPELKLIEEIENENLDEFHAKVMADFNKSISNLL
ncbi:Chaperone protein DnaK [Synechocystis sp. PCC 6714]|nr:Chaperone protein DnaK [Synechocystis sp. PCC 6714]